MTKIKTSAIIIYLFSLALFSSAQTKESEQQLSNYFQQLKASKVDTFIIVKSGCTGCDVVYKDTSENVIDGQTIYVLTQKAGRFKLAIFDDIHNSKYYSVDTCSLFDVIQHNKITLELKDTFYKKELAKLKKSKFFPPRPIHYSFKDLTIQTPDFRYNFLVTDKDADYLGFVRKNEKWFQATKSILQRFFDFSQSIKK